MKEQTIFPREEHADVLFQKILADPWACDYGGGVEGPAVLVAKLKAELEDTMLMCGAHSLAEIDRSMVR